MTLSAFRAATLRSDDCKTLCDQLVDLRVLVVGRVLVPRLGVRARVEQVEVLHRVRRVGRLPEHLDPEVRLVVEDDLEPLRPRHQVQVDRDADLAGALREHLREQEAGSAAVRVVQGRREPLRVRRLAPARPWRRRRCSRYAGTFFRAALISAAGSSALMKMSGGRPASTLPRLDVSASLMSGLFERVRDRTADVDVLERAVLDVDREAAPAARDVGADLEVRAPSPRWRCCCSARRTCRRSGRSEERGGEPARRG